ncbi:MAG TPA: TonB-dependent receptor, partial [Kofleriaceae bacterium]|nr:TonB-dependent receptor [Kofleriaceae bacterium]
EAKVTATYSPIRAVALRAIGGRKGRLPTLRERFRLDIGNEELGPEQVWFGEAEVELAPADTVRATLGSFVRRSNGLIRFDSERSMLLNSGTFDIRGFDAEVEILPRAPVGGGASWSFIDAVSEELGTDSLDFLPRHRGSLWLTARHRRMGGTARLRMQGEQIDRSATLPALVPPDRALVDLSAWAALPADLTGTIRLDNALGADYQIRSGVPAPGPTLSLSIQGEWK